MGRLDMEIVKEMVMEMVKEQLLLLYLLSIILVWDTVKKKMLHQPERVEFIFRVLLSIYRRLAFVLIFPKNCACAHIWQAKQK